jgi:hypothetical protein
MKLLLFVASSDERNLDEDSILIVDPVMARADDEILDSMWADHMKPVRLRHSRRRDKCLMDAVRYASPYLLWCIFAK